MSIFVVTTQAFTVDTQEVVVDWQYNPWGDSNIALSNEVYDQVTDNSVTFRFRLTNNDPDIASLTVRVELVTENGDRVAITSPSNTYPDDDTQWLVAAEQTTGPILSGEYWDSGLFSFVDDKVDSTIDPGNGYFVVYTSTGSTMDSLDQLIGDYTPVLAWDGIIRPTASNSPTSWSDPGWAYDTGVDYLTSAATLSGKIDYAIDFTTWTTSEHGAISQVEINILLTLTGLVDDEFTITVTSGAYTVGTQLYTMDPGTVTLSWTDTLGPGSDGWSYLEITSLNVNIVGVQSKGPDNISFEVFDIWCDVTLQ